MPSTEIPSTEIPSTEFSSTEPPSGEPSSGERRDLLQTLRRHRGFLRFTVQGLSDEQAAQRTTASGLCLGGLVKHVADTERNWADFAREGARAKSGTAEGGAPSDEQLAAWAEGFRMLPGETLRGLLDHYDEVAAATDELIATVPDLDADHALPAAPWFEPGARWSIRRVVLHLIAETAQHAGHADILRESLDGQKTMG